MNKGLEKNEKNYNRSSESETVFERIRKENK